MKPCYCRVMTDLSRLDVTRSLDDQNDYDCAVHALRLLAHQGYESEDEDFMLGNGRTSQIMAVGPDREAVAMLLQAAMKDVDPHSTLGYDREAGYLQMTFSDQFEKPPVRAVWHRLEAIKEDFLSCAHHNSSGYYAIKQSSKYDFQPILFATNFVTEDHPICFYYTFTGQEPFTDSQGTVHQPSAIVPYVVMDEYVAAHPDCGIDHVDNLTPVMAAVDAHSMQHILDSLGVSAQQKAGLSH